MIKAVLFDLDNTLIDFGKFKKKAITAAANAMAQAGLKIDPEEPSRKLIEFYYFHGIESDNAFEEFLKKELGYVDYRILAAGVNAYLKEKYLTLKPYPRVIETLKGLKQKGLKLGVVTDGIRLKAWMRLNETGLDKFFDTVVTFDDTKKNKPSPEPFLKAIKQLNLKPEECLFVGDWPERDIEGARRVGMKTCFARYGHQGNIEKSGADYSVDDVVEILEIVKSP